MSVTKIEFRDEVNRILYEKGLTRAELAKRSGLSSVTISNIINCRRRPSVKSANAIARTLGIDEEAFRKTLFEIIAV